MVVTIKFDQIKKEAKALIQYLESLPYIKIETPQGLGKVKSEKLTPKQRKLINILKKVKKNADSGNTKIYRPINELLDEL